MMKTELGSAGHFSRGFDGSVPDLLRITTRSYDKFAQEYCSHHATLSEVGSQLDRFIELVKNGTILDVGCGHGRDLGFLSSKGFRTVGIDLSEKLLRIAREGTRGELARMDMRMMGFPSEMFDGIWACASFLHIPKSEALRALSEFYRVLKPNSAMYLSVKRGDSENFAETEPGFVRFFSYYTPEEIKGFLVRSGFDIVAVDLESKKDLAWIDTYVRRPVSSDRRTRTP
jgi:SAM-dependent methyltransferase